MKALTIVASAAILALTAGTGWGDVTQYGEPLPAGMARIRTFLDGYAATSVAGAWSANANVYGHTVQNSSINPGWVNAGPYVNGTALQWSGVNFTSTGTHDVWLSWIFLADTAGKTVSYTVSAGPDADHLTDRGTGNLTTAAYDTGMYWTKIGSAWQFKETDTVVRLTVNTSYDYLFYVLGVDELVFAYAFDTGLPTAATPVPKGFGLQYVPNEADVTVSLDQIRAAGAKFVRIPLYSTLIETPLGQYDFSYYDTFSAACAARGMRVIYTYDCGNPLYGNTDVTSAAWRQCYTNFVTATTAHFAGQGNIYEIWNEPNWKTDGSEYVDNYMVFLKQVAPAIRAADPSARIMAPSIGPVIQRPLGTGYEYLAAAFQQGLLDYVDGVAIHPYVDPPTATPESNAAVYATVRSLMQTYGGKTLPLLSSEWGYTMGTPGITAQTQGDYLPRSFLFNLSQDVPLSNWYQFMDMGTFLPDWEQSFGTVTVDRVEKPAYQAMKTMTAALADTVYTGKLSDGNANDWLLTFANTAAGRSVLAAWTTGDPVVGIVPGWGKYLLTHTPLYVGAVRTRDNGGGNWYDAAWAGGSVWTEGGQATFNAAGSTVTVNGTPSVSAIQFGNSGYTLAGGTLVFTAGGAAIHADYDATINSVLAGGGSFATFSLRKSGAGTLTLGGANTFTGGVRVGQGTLKLANSHALDDLDNTVIVFSGGAIDVNGWIPAAYTLPWEIHGTGVNNTGALLNSSAANAGLTTFDVTLGGNSAIGVTGSGYLTLGVVEGGYALTKVGPGVLVLSGNSTYMGATTISAGKLQLAGGNDRLPVATAVALANASGAVLDLNGNSQTVASLSGGGTTGGNVTLGSGILTVGNAAAATYAGAISGTGGQLVKQDAGLLTLSGVNSYTGGTAINAGSLKFNSTSAVPATGTILVNAGGALLASGAYTTAQKWLNSGKVNTASAGTLALVANTSAGINLGSYAGLSIGSTGTYTYSGALTPSGSTYRFGGGGGTLTVSSSLTGARGLVTNGSVTLGGTNSYTGGTTVNSGTLKFNTTSAIPASGTILVNPGGAVLVSGAYTTIQNWLNSGKLNAASAGALALAANSTETVSMGGYTSLSIGANGTYTYGGTLTPAGGMYRLGGGAGTLTVSGALTGANGLAVNGNVTLTGVNSHTGATVVNAGTLTLSGAASINSSGSITLNGGTLLQNSTTAIEKEIAFVSGTLGGTGLYGGSFAAGICHLSPGSGGIGTLTIRGNVGLSGGSVLDFDFGVTEGSNDMLLLQGGAVDLCGTLNITCSGTLQTGRYVLISGASQINDLGLVFGKVPAGYHYSYSVNNNALWVLVTKDTVGEYVNNDALASATPDLRGAAGVCAAIATPPSPLACGPGDASRWQCQQATLERERRNRNTTSAGEAAGS